MSPTITASSEVTEREARQVEQANASGRTPVVFIHGLWLLPSSWDRWADLFGDAGYAAVTPSWPDDPETVDEARANPDVFARKTIGQVADHTAELIGGLDEEARGHGPLDRRIAGADHRRPGSVSGDGGDRSRSVPRCAAASDLDVAGLDPGASKPLEPGPCRRSHSGPVQVRLGECPRRRGGEAAVRDVPRGGAGRRADADGQCQPEPAD